MKEKHLRLINSLSEHGFSVWKSYQAVFNVAPKPASVYSSRLLNNPDFLSEVIKYVDQVDKTKLSGKEIVSCNRLLNKAMEKSALLLCQ